MARKKAERPEWFKLWRRNRQQIDLSYIGMESRGVIFTNLLRLFDTGETELLEMSPVERVLFDGLRVNVDQAYQEWEKISETGRENVMKRWGREQQSDTAVYGGIQGIPLFSGDTEDRIQRSDDRIQRSDDRNFSAPTFSEIQSYISSRGYSVDGESFFKTYSESGWKVGTEPMRNWRAMVDAWERRAKDGGSARNINHGAADQAPDIPGITRL